MYIWEEIVGQTYVSDLEGEEPRLCQAKRADTQVCPYEYTIFCRMHHTELQGKCCGVPMHPVTGRVLGL